MNYTAVKIGELDYVWGDFSRFIQDALDSGESGYGIEDIEHMLFRGEATLWIAYNGSPAAAGVTWFEYFPKMKDLNMAFAGGEMKHIKALVEMGERYAAEKGCDGIRCYGREGWSRALDGYKVISTISRKEL